MPDQTDSLAKRFLLQIALPTIGLACLYVVNQWVFHKLFGTSYVRWYVSAGPFIGLATAAFGAAWGDLDKNTGLVSSNTLTYIRSCLKLAGLPLLSLGRAMDSRYQTRRPGSDTLFTLPMAAVFTVAILGWLVLITPLQYFLFLVCGAPSRIAQTSTHRVYAVWEGSRLKYAERIEGDPLPKGWWDASMRDKPVTLANAFGAAALFIIGQLWS